MRGTKFKFLERFGNIMSTQSQIIKYHSLRPNANQELLEVNAIVSLQPEGFREVIENLMEASEVVRNDVESVIDHE